MNFLFFDLDDTIFDFKKAESIALKKTLSAFGIPPTDATIARYSAINQSLWERLEREEITRDDVKIGRFALLFQELGIKADAKKVTMLYQENLSHGHYYVEGAEEAIQALAKRYVLSLVSNGTSSVQRGRLAGCSVLPCFSHVFLSEDLGVEKPSPLFFERAFAAIEGFDKAKALIVGDSLTSDILGGIQAGIKTCWFNPHGKKASAIPPDYTISSWKELDTVLQDCFPESI
ncbi:MAG: YjjG family noncanonical pyrimidine nucleotidase [Clostridia bacterium]|nr:YjjG family noncanonical pyrimidine nucleotidase [Clostridia bacterium]